MRTLHRVTRLLAAALLVSGLSVCMFAQSQEPQQKGKGERDRMSPATTMTGCLNKDSSGNYMLTDETTGMKTTVAGAADLEKHSANHKVSLTGVAKTDPNGKSVFEVTKVTHISDTCKVP